MKKIVLLFLLLSTFLIAHKISEISLSAKLIDGNVMEIIGVNTKAHSFLDGNKIQLLSYHKNNVLFEGFLSNGKIITAVPTSPYFIILNAGKENLYIEGIVPESQFNGIFIPKKGRVFNILLSICSLLILSAIILILKNNVFKRMT